MPVPFQVKKTDINIFIHINKCIFIKKFNFIYCSIRDSSHTLRVPLKIVLNKDDLPCF